MSELDTRNASHSNAYAAYASYQLSAALALEHYAATRAAVWSSIATACVELSLSERGTDNWPRKVQT